MSQLYVMNIGETTRRNPNGPEDRLSQRAAILTITALSLLLWSPILLPLAALLHR